MRLRPVLITEQPTTVRDYIKRLIYHSERLYQATYLSKVIFSSVSILITELASQSLKNRTGQEFEYPTVISQFIYV